MARRQPVRALPLLPSRAAASGIAYLLLCGSVVFAGATLGVAALAVSPRDLPMAPPQAFEIPVARIQSLPDRNNLCRALVFHNDSGRYQETVLGKCIIPKDMQMWTFPGRAAAFAEAFRSSWRGDSVALSSH
jgi:hypothetical protein